MKMIIINHRATLEHFKCPSELLKSVFEITLLEVFLCHGIENSIKSTVDVDYHAEQEVSLCNLQFFEFWTVNTSGRL